MKKLYTLFTLALLAVTANAQNFKVVLEDGTEVQNGGTVITYAEEKAYDVGGGKVFIMVECGPEAPYVVNQTSVPINVSGTVKAATKDDENKVQWCGFDGQCDLVSTAGKSKATTVAKGERTPMAVHGQFSDKVYATYTAYVTLTSGAQSFQYTQVFQYDEEHTGVTSVKVDAKSLKIYDLSGARIAAEKLKRGQVYVINGKRCLITK